LAGFSKGPKGLKGWNRGIFFFGIDSKKMKNGSLGND
jgi:hypothetical protein